jgi:hypothetical protein
LDSGLEIKERDVKYRYGFLEKSSKGIQKILKIRNEVIREKWEYTISFGKNGE